MCLSSLNRVAIVFVCFFFSVGNASAQSYFPLDDDAALYCVYFPDGTSAPGIYDSNTKNIGLADFDEERARIEKLIKTLGKRINTLKKIIRDKVVGSKERTKIQRIYRATFSAVFKIKNAKIISGVKGIIRRTKKLQKASRKLLVRLQECQDRELVFDPNGGAGAALEYVSFQFMHPDFNVLYYMNGIVLTATFPKSKKTKTLCVSGDENFPSEARISFTTEICSIINSSIVFNPVYCPATQAGFSETTAIAWQQVSISPVPPSSSTVKDYKDSIERIGQVYSRAYKKKQGCRD